MVSHDSNADHNGADSYASRFSHPLIDSVRNGWQSHPSPAYQPLSSSPDTQNPGWIQVALSVVSAPRFRRYVVVYLVLFLLGWAGWALVLYPRLHEREDLLHSLDPSSKIEAGGWFGTNSLPKFDDLTQITSLDPSLVPVAQLEGEYTGSRSQRRLVVVGDVHGCKEECMFLWGSLGEHCD